MQKYAKRLQTRKPDGTNKKHSGAFKNINGILKLINTFKGGLTMKYYKITNKDEIHRGLQYKTGLNVDIQTFNPTGDCQDGGIYFAREDILSFLSYGLWIREVMLPKDARIYKNPGTPEKWKADKVILGQRRKITAEVVKELIAEGAKATEDALYRAAERGHLEIVKVLLSAGAKPTEDAIYWAADRGYLEVVKILLKAGAKATDYALNGAARNGYLELVKVLLSAGAKPMDVALNYAAGNGHLEVVNVLLSAGAKPTDVALDRAAIYGYLEIVKVLEAARKEKK